MFQNRGAKSGIFVLTSVKLVLLFFVASFFVNPLVSARAFEEAKEKNIYVVKLLENKSPNILENFGKNITPRFTQTQAHEFKNIYTFESTYELNFLQEALKASVSFISLQHQLKNEAIVTNDPGFTSNPLDVDKTWGLTKVGFTKAWEKTTGSKTNVVAVIDTGIDFTHEDLKTVNFMPGFDFISNKIISEPGNSDDNGHGTLVAGILGATPNNGLGIVGTNWDISLMPIKALDSSGKGDSTYIAESIVWATDNGAQFINLSIGGIGFGHDNSLAEAITYAFNRNVLIVAAAGNDVAVTGGNIDQNPIFPICDDNNYNMVIGVTAIDHNDTKPEFANFGKNCIDVSAPGKRILSTINYDPLNKKLAPNSYAYASGTSLGVPYVVGQAALIKSLYPNASNIQLRDRIIGTSESVDSLNLSQCLGNSCRGLLGTGRINVSKSIEARIVPDFSEGDLVKISDSGGLVYQIIGGQKRLVSSFVFNQRFSDNNLKNGVSSQIAVFPEGPYVTPLDGTLVKFDSSPTVYVIINGQKLPITGEVFKQRKYDFKQVQTLSFSELNSWTTASFLSPEEGSLIKSYKNKTVYWVVNGVLHPINYKFYIDRGLNIFPILQIPDNDIQGYARGEAYIR